MEWSGFHRKTVEERRQHLSLKFPSLFPAGPADWPLDSKLPIEVADNMIENCIGTMSLPLGLAVGLCMNGQRLIVPMAVEEPSIVAGCCLVCNRLVDEFTTSSSGVDQVNIVVAQLLLETECEADITHFNTAVRPELERLCAGEPLMVRLISRGAKGLVGMELLQPPADESRMMWLNLHIDVGDINGANTVTKLAEHLAPHVERLLPGCRCLMKICSNLCAQRTATAEIRVPVERFQSNIMTGREICRRITLANQWAKQDPYRATTHNKGIMNGVDAVAVATGQDWRAIEAACHAFASGAHQIPPYGESSATGGGASRYRALTDYWIEVDSDDSAAKEFLCARLTLPLAVATAGGVCRSNDTYRYAMGLMQFPDSQKLAQIMVCVGLACNLAALRALVTEGLTAGHMKLHAKNIALAAGAPPNLVGQVVDCMVKMDRIDLQTASAYLDAHHIHRRHGEERSAVGVSTPNILLFEAESVIDEGGGKQRIVLNVAFGNLTGYEHNSAPLFLELSAAQSGADQRKSAVSAIFGGDKSYQWILSLIKLTNRVQRSLAEITIRRDGGGDENISVAVSEWHQTLVILFILMTTLLRRLVRLHPAVTEQFVHQTNCFCRRQERSFSATVTDPLVATSLSLLHALYQSIRLRLLNAAAIHQSHIDFILETIQRFVLAVVDSPRSIRGDGDFLAAGTRWCGLDVILVLLLADPSASAEGGWHRSVLQLFRRLGELLNCEMGAWHDLNRLDRDLTDRRRLELNTVQRFVVEMGTNISLEDDDYDDDDDGDDDGGRLKLRSAFLHATIQSERFTNQVRDLVQAATAGDECIISGLETVIATIRQSIQELYSVS